MAVSESETEKFQEDFDPKNPENLINTREVNKSLEKLEGEFSRRLDALNRVRTELGIPENHIVLKPPILNRTDFGYISEVDLLLIGPLKESDSLYEALLKKHTLAHIIHMPEADFVKIGISFPEMHDFLEARRGNLPKIVTPPNFEHLSPEEENTIENIVRNSVTKEERAILREDRKNIAKKFLSEASVRIRVIAHNISGSLVENTPRLGPNSDIDLDILTDPSEEEIGMSYDYIEIYLKWKYAEEYGVKIDVVPDTLKKVKEMAKYNKLKTHYEKIYNITL